MRRDRGKKSKEQEEAERLRRIIGYWPARGHLDNSIVEDENVHQALDAAFDQRQREEAEDFFQNLDSDNGYHTKDDIRYHIGALSPDGQRRTARAIGESCGPYRELVWLSGSPRIFATDRHRDHVAERNSRRLIHFLSKIGGDYRPGALIDPSIDHGATAVAAAYRNLRPIEQRVLLARLTGNRVGDATWESISRSTAVGSVPLAIEIFKVAVTEFLLEHHRIAALAGDESKKIT